MHLEEGKFVLREDFYWNSPQPFWEGMPQQLHHELSTSRLTFIKGDANYRRVHGDLRIFEAISFFLFLYQKIGHILILQNKSQHIFPRLL
jgi:hypothetical protein